MSKPILHITKPTHSYIGRCPGCKGVTAYISDIPEFKRRTASEVAQLIRDGLEIERLPSDSLPELNGCSCHQAQPETLPLFTKDTTP